MKRIAFLFVFFMAAVGMSAQEKYSEIKFDTTEYDFGTFYRDVNKLSHTFTFKNVGNHPAVINQVITTCGCTVATYTTKPVLPGKTGTVNIVYNAIGRFPGNSANNAMIERLKNHNPKNKFEKAYNKAAYKRQHDR